jgi:hypothetical protein
LVLDDEDQAELEALTGRLMDEIGPTGEVEAHLVQRLAAAFWKGERAERLEVALFDAAPRRRPPEVGGRWVEADPLATFDLARFNAIRLYQAQQGREVSRCLRDLRLLRREPLTAEADEREDAPAIAGPEARNEPGEPAAASPEARNEPEAPAAAPPPAPRAAAPASPPLVAVENEPERPVLLRPRYPVPLPDPLDEALIAHGAIFTAPCTVGTGSGRERPGPQQAAARQAFVAGHPQSSSSSMSSSSSRSGYCGGALPTSLTTRG